MTASSIFPRDIGALALVLALVVAAAGCTPARDHGADRGDRGVAALVDVSGDFAADGSCRAVVNGTALFAPRDRPRSAYDPGPVADIAPAGYTLRQITCTRAGSDPSLPPERAGERMVLVTLYARDGAPVRAGRYDIRSGVATADDSAGVSTRAGVAVFGAPSIVSARDASRAGVRYLEGRSGTLTLVSAAAGGVVGTFTMRAGEAWSM